MDVEPSRQRDRIANRDVHKRARSSIQVAAFAFSESRLARHRSAIGFPLSAGAAHRRGPRSAIGNNPHQGHRGSPRGDVANGLWHGGSMATRAGRAGSASPPTAMRMPACALSATTQPPQACRPRPRGARRRGHRSALGRTSSFTMSPGGSTRCATSSAAGASTEMTGPPAVFGLALLHSVSHGPTTDVFLTWPQVP